MANIKANDLSGFSFRLVSSGAYMVEYTTPQRGDFWRNRVEDMTVIDATKNAEWAKVADIQHLRNIVKRGAHYNKYGERID